MDEGLLAEAAREGKRKRPSPAVWGGLAACAALAALLLGPGLAQLPRGPVKYANTSPSASAGLSAAPAGAPGASGPVTLPGGEENPPPSVLPDTGEGGSASVLPYPGEGESPAVTALIIVEDYRSTAIACYATPKNGKAGLSIPLREAMEAYGSGAQYRVAMQLFADEQPLDLTGPEAASEIQRLAELGFDAAYEEAYRDGELYSAAVTLHATREQLTDFPVSPELGTMIFLYREFFR